MVRSAPKHKIGDKVRYKTEYRGEMWGEVTGITKQNKYVVKERYMNFIHEISEDRITLSDTLYADERVLANSKLKEVSVNETDEGKEKRQ